jgi:hypothetical protein
MTEDTWSNNMNEYLRTIGCPIVWTTRSQQPTDTHIPANNLQALIWLARHSISLDCEDSNALSPAEMNAASLSSTLEGLRGLLTATDRVTNDTELVRKATQNVKFMTLSTKSEVLQQNSLPALAQSLTFGGSATETGKYGFH